VYDGVGVYKSENGGASWQHAGLENAGSIGKVLVHPDDPDRVYVAAMGVLFGDNSERGVFRTTNGGQHWEKVLFVTDSTGAVDLAMHPTQPDIIYAATWERVRRVNRTRYGGPTSGIYRSTDGGDSWVKLTNGLPSADLGRIGLATSPADPNLVYAVYATESGDLKGVYRSTDSGHSWSAANSNQIGYSSFMWWFGKMYVSPANAAHVFVLSLQLYRSLNGTANWKNVTQSQNVHVDQHALYIHPADPDLLVLGNDGGVYISEDGGETWAHKNTLPVTQFYACEIDNSLPARLYGGSQDNGTVRTLTGSTGDWQGILGGDGCVVRVDPSNNNYVYASFQNGFMWRSTNGGTTFTQTVSTILSSERRNWKTPYTIDPNSTNVLYYGTFRMYRSTNRALVWSPISPNLSGQPTGGTSRYGTLTSIDVSPVDANIIYAGTDDGRVWNTTDGGDTWNLLSNGLPDRWVTSVAAHPVNPQSAFVTFSGFRFDEYLPHVFRTDNNGQAWIDISGNLPEVPVNDIVVDPDLPDRLYLANDVGVYFSFNGGGYWELLGTGLPDVPVTDLCLHNPTKKLVAATHGRSLYSVQVDQLTGNIPLPVELVNFVAYPQGRSVILEWQTASERNNSHFLVERSADGRSFAAIAQVAGAGSGSQFRNYQSIDLHPLRGLNYYRLRQVDFDGQFEFSPVRVVDFIGKAPEMAVFPVPAGERLTVDFGEQSPAGAMLAVFNAKGQRLRSATVPEGAVQMQIDLDGLPQGIFFLYLENRNGVKTGF
jgi:hypothetical protein